jgi:asparagine synthase (glutamine-hydrolysing)
MPGIVGIISRRPAEQCHTVIKAMLASMKHEPIYTSGTYSVPEMGVFTGWIALDGSFASDQVFFNKDKNIALVWAGECFVDSTSSPAMRENGANNNGEDNIVRLYERKGSRFVGDLNGLFSGFLIDKARKTALLFNDRYGSERIYWHETSDAFYFASEAKALLRVLPALREFDPAGVAEFLTFGCTLEERTLFRGIQRLPGGSLWSFKEGTNNKERYFYPETWESQPILSPTMFESRFQETFNAVLPRYLGGKNRLGVSLTGGLDTRMIMACLASTTKKPVCYTFSGRDGQTLDDRIAAKVAKACGLEHQLLRIGSDFFSDFSDHLDRTVYVTDASLGATGAHEIYLNEQARELALVRLTGNFGSEVLRGVSTFKPVGLTPSLLSSQFSCSDYVSPETIANQKKHPVTFAAFGEIPWKLYGNLAASRSQVIFRTPYLDNEIVALAYQAPENLRTSSRPAWHVVDTNNALLSKIPTDRGRSRHGGLGAKLRRLLAETTFKLDYLNNEGWPHWLCSFDPIFTRITSSLKIVGLHKYLHYRSWFRHELSDYLEEVVTDARMGRSDFWNSSFLERMVKDHIAGRRNYVSEINAVLTLEAVKRLFFKGLPLQTEGTDSPQVVTAVSTAES